LTNFANFFEHFTKIGEKEKTTLDPMVAMERKFSTKLK
jgi:hypothetical protein